MAVPDVIPITHASGYRTCTIGRYTDGQFLASMAYASPDGDACGEDWRERRRLFVALHRFDFDGHHVGSDIWCAGTWAQQQRRPYTGDSVAARATTRMANLLESLRGRRYEDIAIRPFGLHFEDVFFGLVIEPDGDGRAVLYPDRIGFGAPWDGARSR